LHRLRIIPGEEGIEHRPQLRVDIAARCRDECGDLLRDDAAGASAADKVLLASASAADVLRGLARAVGTQECVGGVEVREDVRVTASRTGSNCGYRALVAPFAKWMILKESADRLLFTATEAGSLLARCAGLAQYAVLGSDGLPRSFPARHASSSIALVIGVAVVAHSYSIESATQEAVLAAPPARLGARRTPTGTADPSAVCKRVLDWSCSGALLAGGEQDTARSGGDQCSEEPL
jgi:hypothetical protein